VIALGSALGACGTTASGRITALSAARPARWTAAVHVRRVLDFAGPRRDGAVVVAAAGRLALLHLGGASQPFASGYVSPGGEEAYIALSSGERVRAAGCTFGSDVVYALRLADGPGVTIVDARGNARRFASLASAGLENGIAFDDTGRFGHRLLVTATAGNRTTVSAIDCRGRVAVLTRDAPKVEGGIAVAPASFGRFGGDLIAPDENSGRIYAIAANGVSQAIATSGLPHGGDIGVESEGFVPRRLSAGWSALVADRLTPGNPHPGEDVALRATGASLIAAGVRPGDLLVATEGGAKTDAIRCADRCVVRHVADGPATAHLEGHIAFVAHP
jgi:hypothetical protein